LWANEDLIGLQGIVPVLDPIVEFLLKTSRGRSMGCFLTGSEWKRVLIDKGAIPIRDYKA
jgi:hypothetical protein